MQKILFLCTVNQNYDCHDGTNILKHNHILPPQIQHLTPLQEKKSLPGFTATIFTGENASTNGGTIINALSNYDMKLGTMKQSCTKNFFALKRRSKILYQEIQ